MRKEERIEGTAFTRQRTVVEKTEGPEELAAGLKEMSRRLQDPWGEQQPIRDWIESALQQEQERRSPGQKWQARVDAGWYLEELRMHGNIADSNIAKGDAKWAAFAGMMFGALWSEFQLKLAREELYLLGKLYKDKSEEGAAIRRRGDQAARVREVNDRPPGMSKRQMFRRIAKRESVTWQAIEADYYKAKKST